MLPLLCIPVILLAPSVAVETVLFISIPLPSRHFCTAFTISSSQVCPESGKIPSSYSFGPWDDIYLTKRVTCAVSFMSQDSSIASNKAEASGMYSNCIRVTLEDILAVLSCIVLADNGKSLIFFMISAFKITKQFFRCTYKEIFDVLTICE
ncbi:hypothetical protein AVEN_103789-1 [Araneus ventricosus]|uniref:Secreted protein n=1 Tax=Araneus ventricosus TaxID=182803 RepID=A0A4Y2GJ71_ARAVE|nr:hypothetical protein AVEN_103789-1 [Araneus ventricosus]